MNSRQWDDAILLIQSFTVGNQLLNLFCQRLLLFPGHSHRVALLLFSNSVKLEIGVSFIQPFINQLLSFPTGPLPAVQSVGVFPKNVERRLLQSFSSGVALRIDHLVISHQLIQVWFLNLQNVRQLVRLNA